MTRRDAALAVLALLLAGALAARIGAGLEEPPAATAAGPVDAPAVAAAPNAGFVPPPLSDFDAVVARPLFLPERRPAAAQTPSAVPVAADLRLVGVVTVRGRAAAVLRAADGRTFTAAPGEGGEGWSVVTVGPDGAVVARGGVRQELTLSTRPRTPAAVTAAQPPRAGDPGDP